MTLASNTVYPYGTIDWPPPPSSFHKTVPVPLNNGTYGNPWYLFVNFFKQTHKLSTPNWIWTGNPRFHIIPLLQVMNSSLELHTRCPSAVLPPWELFTNDPPAYQTATYSPLSHIVMPIYSTALKEQKFTVEDPDPVRPNVFLTGRPYPEYYLGFGSRIMSDLIDKKIPSLPTGYFPCFAEACYVTTV